MLNLARHTLRHRWGAFVGPFVALMLGVALLSTMGLVLAATVTDPGRGPDHGPDRGPGRFAAAPVVVRGEPDLTVPDPWGGQDKEPLEEPRGLSDALVAKARAASGGRTVLDRSFPVQLAGGPDRQVGHGWPSAALAPYRL
ncbi:ABC transporter permease, partial [Streptomyces sp. NPDC057654]